MSDLAAALMVAIRVHSKQVDKQGEPYLLHVLRVVEAVSDEAKVVAALHDVLEDGRGNMPLADLVGLVSLSMGEEAALDALTHKEDQTYAAYIDGLRERSVPGALAELSREVKLADLRDNLGRIPEIAVEKPGDEERYDMWQSLRLRYERAIDTLEASS